MCFSATASIATAAVTGSVGALTLGRVGKWNEAPLAAIPLIFGVQQAVEGLLWVSLGDPSLSANTKLLANTFAVFALVLWPLWSPLAAGLVEPVRRTRFLMAGLFLAAIPLAAYGAMNLAANPYGACVSGHSLLYTNGHPYTIAALVAYGLCTCLPPLLSSHRALRWFGLLVLTGLAVSTVFFAVASFSVWCFFAAAGSVAVYAYFAWSPKVAPAI